jgi:hypothetical protein
VARAELVPGGMLLKFGSVSVIGAETGGSARVKRVPTEGACGGGGADKKEGEGEVEVISGPSNEGESIEIKISKDM